MECWFFKGLSVKTGDPCFLSQVGFFKKTCKMLFIKWMIINTIEGVLDSVAHLGVPHCLSESESLSC